MPTSVPPTWVYPPRHVYGTLGSDTIIGTADSEIIYGSQGTDTVDGGGGSGYDKLWFELDNTSLFAFPNGPLSFTLTHNQFYDASGSVDTTFTGIESIGIYTRSTSFAPSISVDLSRASVNVSISLLGTGHRTITGSSFNDSLGSGSGDDMIHGGAGDDVIESFDGDDVLIGGHGNDLLSGGLGNDTFRGTRAEFFRDRIADFAVGDRINITDVAASEFRFSLFGTTLRFDGASIDVGALNFRMVLNAAAAGTYLVAVNRMSGLTDFGGEGHSDILLTTASGSLVTWRVTGSTTLQLNKDGHVASVPTGWHAVETLDFNGDGRSDILWRHHNGGLTVWNSGADDLQTSYSPFQHSAYNDDVATSWKIAATGDVNGDGKDEIVWQHDDGSITVWQSTGTGFIQGLYGHASVGTQSNIIGMADFDGDNKDDLLWRDSEGSLSVWRSTGSGFEQNSYFDDSVRTSSGWHIAGLGDFNGDGRDDIVWRNDKWGRDCVALSRVGRVHSGRLQCQRQHWLADRPSW